MPLYITATPIGNLKDITLRALEVLKSVDLIAAEDTRHTRKLLSHYNISTPLTSYHARIEKRKAEVLIERLKNGEEIALVSDAGTPGISDPGSRIIRLAIKERVEVISIPGPCALITALSVSGMPTDRFFFEGFLPVKKGARQKKLKELAKLERTVVFYESPHRIVKTLNDILDVVGDRDIVCVREATKLFEEVRRQKVGELLSHFESTPPRGEFVVMM